MPRWDIPAGLFVYRPARMIDQYSGLLQSAVYNAKTRRVEVKSNLWDDDRLWTPAGASSSTQDDQTTTYYRAVPWLMRAIELRANAVASVPMRILRGETEVDNTEAWQNKIGIIPDPYRLLWSVEAALCFGPAYLWRERNRVKTTGLRYIVPSTITPRLDAATGLVGFTRQIGAQRLEVTPEDILYFWKPDPFVEIGAPLVTPVGAALGSAGVLYNLDQFSAAFWARGAIKATLLTVEGPASQDDKNELKRWWEKVVTGINNAFAGRVVNAAVKPVVVGEGLESLQNNDLTNKQREDILTALGIPFSVMNSTAAGGLGGGGVVSQDEQHFYDKTVRPECNFIASVLNDQLFTAMGLRCEFNLESLDVFQEDENQRAVAFKTYVDAGLPIELAGAMLGLELPDGWTWERIAAEKEARQQEMAAQMQGQQPQSAPEQPGQDVNAQVDAIVAGITKDARAELFQWRRWATKRVPGDLTGFHVNGHLPAHVADAIKADLAQARTKDDVSAAFAPWLDAHESSAKPAQVEALVDALRTVTEALLHAE